MMRGPEKNAMAVRRANGEIFFEESLNQKKKRWRVCRWPVIRGVFGFIDSMVIGYKALMRSAEIAIEDEMAEEENKNNDKTAQQPQNKPVSEQKSDKGQEGVAAEKSTEKEKKSAIGKGTMTAITIIATVLGIGLAVALFIWLPSFLYNLIAEYTPTTWG